eukprot:XP_015570756.1 probable disease resistance protein RF9 [Ricinus communis]
MVVEITVSLLIGKLNNLLAERDIICPGLRSQVRKYIQELEHLQRFLNKGSGNELALASSISLLPSVYSSEDMVDKFLVKLFRRRRIRNHVMKFLPSALLSASIQFSFTRQMQKFLSNDATKFSIMFKIAEDQRQQNKTEEEEENGSQSREQPKRWSRIADFLKESYNIVGLEDQRHDLVQLLLSRHGRWLPSIVIAVVGAAGSGKTTLVKFIYNRVQEVKQHFECCAWVNVSEEFQERDVLISILRQISEVTEEETLSLEALRIRVKYFLSRRTYLIVLDDIHSRDAWEILKFGFSTSVMGSRVILTMRSIEVARSLTPWISLFQIRPLNPQESWQLFLQKLRRPANGSELKSLQELIVRKCAGLPLAVVTLGGLLSTKPYAEWSMVIESDTFKSSSLNILAMSYQDLPSPVKSCLLYSGLFPKSHEIPIRRLLLLWLAEGLAISSHGGSIVPEDLVETHFEELVIRNMIVVEKWRLDGSPKTCKVQAALYDTILPTATDMGFFHVHRNYDYKDKPPFNVRRIAEYLDINCYPSDTSHIGYLRSYISFNTRKGDTPADQVDNLLKKISKRGFGLLTVLDLEYVYKPVLSEALGKLLHLRYLGLRWTFLDWIPESIGKLPCLETLDVKHTNIPALPISIWKAKKLRHLYMNDIHFGMSFQKQGIKVSLTNLQTLWGLLVGKSCSVINWLQQLTNLRKLGLTCLDSSVQKIINWIPELKENLESLRLRSINEFNEPSDLDLGTMKQHKKLSELHLFGRLVTFDMHELPPNLTMLTLSVSQLEQDPMPILGKLPRLSILRLFANSYLGKQMSSPRNGFPELRVLKLWMLEELEEWTVEEGSMRELQKLEIRCCTNLKLPGGLYNLAALDELTLTNMPGKFVADIRTNTKRSVKISTHYWKFPTLPK